MCLLGWIATSATLNNFGTVVSGGAYSFTFTNFQNAIVVNPGESIQAAIDAAAPGSVIVVLPGNYTESFLIWKPLILLGPNAGIDPNTGVRGPEACIIPPSVALGPLITISSSGRDDRWVLHQWQQPVARTLGRRSTAST